MWGKVKSATAFRSGNKYKFAHPTSLRLAWTSPTRPVNQREIMKFLYVDDKKNQREQICLPTTLLTL